MKLSAERLEERAVIVLNTSADVNGLKAVKLMPE